MIGPLLLKLLDTGGDKKAVSKPQTKTSQTRYECWDAVEEPPETCSNTAYGLGTCAGMARMGHGTTTRRQAARWLSSTEA